VQPTAAQQALLQRSGELRSSLQRQATGELQRWAPAGRRLGTWTAVGQRVAQAVRQPAVLAGLAAAGVALWLWRRPSRAATVERGEPVAARASRLLGWAMLGLRVWQIVQRMGPSTSATAPRSKRTENPGRGTESMRDAAPGPAPSRRGE
jgi:hypothetical protein